MAVDLSVVFTGLRFENPFLLASAPDSKANLTLDYGRDRFDASLRFVRFGSLRVCCCGSRWAPEAASRASPFLPVPSVRTQGGRQTKDDGPRQRVRRIGGGQDLLPGQGQIQSVHHGHRSIPPPVGYRRHFGVA